VVPIASTSKNLQKRSARGEEGNGEGKNLDHKGEDEGEEFQ